MDPLLHPGKQRVGRQRQKKSQRKVVAVAETLRAQTAQPAHQPPGQRKNRGQESVLNSRMLFLANIHQKGKKGRGPEPATERFEDRRAIKAEAAQAGPSAQGVAKIGNGLQQPQHPHPAESSIARNKSAAGKRSGHAENNTKSSRNESYFEDGPPLINPEGFHHWTDGILPQPIKEDKQHQRNSVPGPDPADKSRQPSFPRRCGKIQARNDKS